MINDNFLTMDIVHTELHASLCTITISRRIIPLGQSSSNKKSIKSTKTEEKWLQIWQVWYYSRVTFCAIQFVSTTPNKGFMPLLSSKYQQYKTHMKFVMFHLFSRLTGIFLAITKHFQLKRNKPRKFFKHDKGIRGKMIEYGISTPLQSPFRVVTD